MIGEEERGQEQEQEQTQLDWLAEHYRGQDPAEADADELADWEAEQDRADDEEEECE